MVSKDQKLMSIARAISELSKDQSTKVGCLIIGEDGEDLAWGYNGFPRGVNDDVPERHERPLKYAWTEHAERNALYSAARNGKALKGGTAYVTSLICCPDCARGLIQSGIKEIVMEDAAFDTNNPRVAAWIGTWPETKTMLDEAGVKVRIL